MCSCELKAITHVLYTHSHNIVAQNHTHDPRTPHLLPPGTPTSPPLPSDSKLNITWLRGSDGYFSLRQYALQVRHHIFTLSLAKYIAIKMAAMAMAMTVTRKTTRVMQTASRGVEAAGAEKRETANISIGSWKGCYILSTIQNTSNSTTIVYSKEWHMTLLSPGSLQILTVTIWFQVTPSILRIQ